MVENVLRLYIIYTAMNNLKIALEVLGHLKKFSDNFRSNFGMNAEELQNHELLKGF